MKYITVLLLVSLMFYCGCASPLENSDETVKIRQLTFEQKKHYLGIFDAWSQDDKWLVYCNGPNETNDTIAKLNVETGEMVTLYKIENQQPYGPGCGTPSYCHTQNKVVFIHGPSHCSPQQKYEFWRRSAGCIEEPELNKLVRIDARDVTYPFTAGASRGGTHCHEWSNDGKLVAFTYNDMIMAQLEEKTGKTLNLRTIGVSADIGSVKVDKDAEQENFDGEYFTVLLVEVAADPKPGSDEVSKAYENCLVGLKGYKTETGKWQRAVAYKGKTVDKNGNEVPELFIVDIPDDITAVGDGPLEGTMGHMPYPPAGAKITRLTYTQDRKYPGLSSDPRFWLSSSYDGDKIFFLMKDYEGLNQVYYASIADKKITQVTNHDFPVTSTVSVCSDGQRITYVADGSVFVTSLKDGSYVRLTPKDGLNPSIPIWSNNGDNIAFTKTVPDSDGEKYSQIFVVSGF
ncbi:MAG: DUF3748 domain-containing protein [Sedimentisphaeraceae bacterium JB056]